MTLFVRVSGNRVKTPPPCTVTPGLAARVLWVTSLLWDIRSRHPIGTPLPGPENINAVAFFAPDGGHVFAVFRDGRGYRWDVREGAWERTACAIAGRQLTRAEWRDALPGRAYAPTC